MCEVSAVDEVDLIPDDSELAKQTNQAQAASAYFPFGVVKA